MATVHNIKGTSVSSFQVGKGGPTIANASGVLTVDSGGSLRLLADINTGTPPTTEAVTSFFEIRDNEDVDSLMQLGFTAASNDLSLINHMEEGIFSVGVTDTAGAVRTYLSIDPDAITALTGDTILELRVNTNGADRVLTAVANGAATVYHDNTQIGITTTRALGGLIVNNDLSHGNSGSASRVLTTADLEAGQPRLAYEFDTVTSASDPGAGNIRFDNATPASVTNIYIDDTSDVSKGGFLDGSRVFDNLADGDVIMVGSMEDAGAYILATVNGTPTDNTGWWTIPLTIVASGTLPGNDTSVMVDVQWISQVGGLGNVSNTGTPLDNQIAVWTDATTIEGDANFTWDGTSFAIGTGANNPVIRDETTSLTNPVFIPASTDLNTGVGADGADALSLIAGGIGGLILTELDSGVITAYDANVGLTANANSSQGDSPITASYNVYSVVATAGDAATLPAVFAAGSVVHVKNDDSSEAMDVFPASGDTITPQSANQAVSIRAGESKTFLGVAANGTWTELIVKDTASQITVADTASSSTFITMTDNATGDEALLTDAGLTYDATSASLSATTFIGALTGTASGNVTASGSPLNNEVAVFTSGTDIDSDSTFTWDGSILTTGDVVISNTGPALFIRDTNSGTDEKNWIVSGAGGQFNIQTATDASPAASVDGVINVTRSGTTVSNVNISSNLTIGSPLVETSGGTGTATYTAGDILYSDASNSLAKLAIGSDGQVLALSSGLPVWQDATSANPGLSVRDYDFDTTTSQSDPGNGNFRFNNATPSSVTFMYIDLLDRGGTDIEVEILANMQTGDRITIRTDDFDTYLNYYINGTFTDFTTYYRVPVIYLAGNNGLPANGELISVDFGTRNQHIPIGTASGNQRDVLYWDDEKWAASGSGIRINPSSPPIGGRITVAGSASSDTTRAALFLTTGNSTSGMWYADGGAGEAFYAIHKASANEFAWGFDNDSSETDIIAIDVNNNFIVKSAARFFIEERSAGTSGAAHNMIWVRDDAPTTLLTTDDAGNEFTLENTISEIEYEYSSAVTSTDPGAGILNFDSVTIGSIANLYIDDLANTGENAEWVLSELADGDILTIRGAADSADYIVASVNGAPSDGSGFWTIPLTLIHTGTIFTDTDPVRIGVQWFSQGGGGVPTTITVADSTDTTSFPAFFEDATGDLGPKTDASNYTYNATTGALTAATFIGALTGTASGNVTASGSPLNNEIAVFTAAQDIDSDSTFTWDGSTLTTADIVSTAASANIYLRETGATADEGNWITRADGDIFRISTATDAAATTPVNDVLRAVRTGTTIDQVWLDRGAVITVGGSWYLGERNADQADIATYGQLWVRDDVPNTALFTDDAGNITTLSNTISEIDYEYSSTVTAADPGAGILRFDSVTIGSIANLYIDDLDNTAEDSAWWLSNLADGDILTFRGAADVADYIVASVNGTPTDNTGWWTVPLTLIHTGTIFANTDPLRISVQWFSQVTSNVTHTGQVTGSTALALDVTAVTAQPASGAIVAGDTIIINDGGVLSEATFTQMNTYFDSSLSFGSGDGTVTSSGSPLNNEVAVFATATDINSDSTFTWDGTTMFATNVTGTNIGGITSTDLLDKSATETVSGAYTFSTLATFTAATNTIEMESANPTLHWDETDAAADERNTLIRGVSGNFRIQSATDAAPTTSVSILMDAQRSGTTWSNVVWDCTSFIVSDGANFRIRGPNDTSYVNIVHDDTDLNITHVTTTDWNITGLTAIQMGTVNLDAAAITATSYGGITEANLLDKSATESVSARWTFTQIATAATDGGSINLTSTQPGLLLSDTDADADEKNTLIFASAGILRFRSYDDAFSGSVDYITHTRTGTAVAVAITGALTATSYGGITEANLLDKTAAETVSGVYTFTAASGVTVNHASATIAVQETGATADEGNWLIRANGDLFRIQTATDGAPNSGADNAIQVSRTGTTVNTVELGNFNFDVDQTVGAGQDNYVLTYDNSGGLISLEASTGGSPVTTDDTAPVSPSDGDLWWDSTVARLFVFYDDGSSTQWVEATPVNLDSVVSTGTPVDNQLAIWTDDSTIEGDANVTYDGTNFTLGTSSSAIQRSFEILENSGGISMSVDTAGSGSINQLSAAGAIEDAWLSMTRNAGVALKYNNTNHIWTMSDGVQITGTITMAEQADSGSSVATLGQIWVNTATPNELWYTTDDGDDIQITSGTTLAGGTGTVTSSGSPLNNEVAVFATATDINSDSTFTWDGTTMFATNVTGTNIGGITQANLLDKTATETVSGAYTFSTDVTGDDNVLGGFHTPGASSVVRFGSYGSLSRLFSSAGTTLANNAHVDPADAVSDRMRTSVTHASYGHTILKMAAGVHTWYGASNSVTAGDIVTKVVQMDLDANANLSIVGTVDATSTTAGTPAALFTNAGTANTIARFVGDSDALEIICSSAGDYEITNNGQDNGIWFADGTGGVDINYAGSVAVECDSTGVALWHLGTEAIQTQDGGASDNITAAEINWRDTTFYDIGLAVMPEVTTTGAITLSELHMHKTILITSGTGAIAFVSDTGMKVGAVGWIINNSGSNNGLTATTGIFWADGAGGQTGSRTLADGGWVTWWKQADAQFYITGIGIT